MKQPPERVSYEMDAPSLEAKELCSEIEKLHAASFAWSLACCRGDRAEAEDVLQTTYLKVLDGRARFAGEGSLKTWLFAVIRRTAAGRKRRRAVRERLRSITALLSSSYAPSQNPEKQVQESQHRQSLRQRLACLSARQRQVLDLVFYHDQTIEQAAAVLGLTLGTARVHYERGKKRLAEALQAEREQTE